MNNEKITSIQTAKHFPWGNGCDGWWLKQDKNFTVIQEAMPAGTSELKHYHEKTEQFFYVLDGLLNIEMSDTCYQVANNQGITVPPKMIHKVSNRSNRTVSFLVISCPDSHNDRINLE